MRVKFRKTFKYKNQPIVFEGLRFDSKKELATWKKLTLLEKAGKISNLRRQVRFEIIPKTDKFRAAFYTADFVFRDSEGIHVVDVKSPATRKNEAYILRKKLLYHRYALTIEEW